MESLKNKINKDKLPKHIAIIMDGNGRWAIKHGLDRVGGHHEGVDSVRDIAEVAANLGIKYLTLYTFSTENWSRPKDRTHGRISHQQLRWRKSFQQRAYNRSAPEQPLAYSPG